MQVTVRKAQIAKKSKRLEQAAERRIYEVLDEAIDFLSLNVPVDTGAYARSMHLNVRGDSSGASETSRRKEGGQQRDTVLNEMEARMRASLDSLDVLDGATFVNNAPHANFVETYYGVFDQLRNILGR